MKQERENWKKRQLKKTNYMESYRNTENAKKLNKKN